MAAKNFEEFINNELKLIVKIPLQQKENDVLLKMCKITWDAAIQSVSENLQTKTNKPSAPCSACGSKDEIKVTLCVNCYTNLVPQ